MSKHLHQQAARSGAGGGVEMLEARVLMAAYTFQSFADLYHLNDPIRSVAPPTGATIEGFGTAAAALGDIDGDGAGDFAVSAPGRGNGIQAEIPGAVFIYSGRTGALIRTLTDGSGGFGFSIADVGDITGDGKRDLLVGSPLFDPDLIRRCRRSDGCTCSRARMGRSRGSTTGRRQGTTSAGRW